MRYLYLDNFRGFTDTFVPIADVSFLVGENSTGKTSLLNLVKVLGSSKFWLGRDFDSDDVKLGHFRDLVSISAPDKSYFRIGFIEQFENSRPSTEANNSLTNASLLTFTEKSGMPDISNYSFTLGDHAVTARFLANKKISYLARPIIGSMSAEQVRQEIFPIWRDDHKRDLRGFKRLPPQKGFIGMSPLLDAFFRLDEILKNEKPSRRGFSPPQFASNIVWLAPIRSQPRRTYDEYKFEFSPEGDHTPYLIKKILSKKSEASKFKTFLEKVGSETGLFEGVTVKRYGKLATSPFELDIILNGKALNVSNVGYGVSQALPVLVELFARPKNSWFAIQQPEVHLHPKAQAAMGEALFTLTVVEKKSFLIETHSDFLVDRFRLNLRESKTKCSAQVLFFERTKTGNKVHALVIDENGDLPEDQPATYRHFFVREQLQILGLDDVSNN